MLSALHYAGADVPAPFACTEKAILMEFVGDEDGDSPQLQYARFADGEAEKVLERILWKRARTDGEESVEPLEIRGGVGDAVPRGLKITPALGR
ncbi:MAG: hypothetical protein IPO34_19780 [Dehalococcoidia bacterium]|nr:hypothetical protein [Dehalococcoidia bacterium]